MSDFRSVNFNSYHWRLTWRRQEQHVDVSHANIKTNSSGTHLCFWQQACKCKVLISFQSDGRVLCFVLRCEKYVLFSSINTRVFVSPLLEIYRGKKLYCATIKEINFRDKTLYAAIRERRYSLMSCFWKLSHLLYDEVKVFCLIPAEASVICTHSRLLFLTVKFLTPGSQAHSLVD